MMKWVNSHRVKSGSNPHVYVVMSFPPNSASLMEYVKSPNI